MSSSHALDPVYFGKVPTRSDFVRYNASRPAVRALDGWLQHGLHAARTRAPRAFEAAYDAAPACCFYFSPSEVPGALIGVMQPSRDRSGRRYPFFVGLDAGGRRLRARCLAQVPVRLQAFFTQAHALARSVANGQLEHDEIEPRIASALLPTRTEAASVRRYEQFLKQTRAWTFWEQLWGHPEDTRKYLLMKNVLDILLPLRARLPVRYTLGLQFPLPARAASADVASADVASACATSFWGDVCVRLLGGPDATPTCFWTVPNGEALRPSMLFFLRPPSASAFPHLLPVELESDPLCVLEQRAGAQSAAQVALDLPARYGTLLEDEQLTLGGFLRRLGEPAAA